MQELEKLDMVVGTGRRNTKWGTMPIAILYVVAMPKDDVRSYVAHENAQDAMKTRGVAAPDRYARMLIPGA